MCCFFSTLQSLQLGKFWAWFWKKKQSIQKFFLLLHSCDINGSPPFFLSGTIFAALRNHNFFAHRHFHPENFSYKIGPSSRFFLLERFLTQETLLYEVGGNHALRHPESKRHRE